MTATTDPWPFEHRPRGVRLAGVCAVTMIGFALFTGWATAGRNLSRRLSGVAAADAPISVTSLWVPAVALGCAVLTLLACFGRVTRLAFWADLAASGTCVVLTLFFLVGSGMHPFALVMAGPLLIAAGVFGFAAFCLHNVQSRAWFAARGGTGRL